MNVADARRGVRDVAPLLLGVVPFGLVAGIAAVETGLTLGEAVAMSVIVFAGASQLAALELLGENAPFVVVVVTAVVINLRMLMYSASIAPYLRSLSGRRRAILAYLLTDQAYVLSVTAYRSDRSVDRTAYYLGVGLTLWVVWQVTTVGGVLLGAGVPDAWGLEFAVPLVFLALLVPELTDRSTAAAAGASGVVAVIGIGLPLNLGLLVGAAVGICSGLLVELNGGEPNGD